MTAISGLSQGMKPERKQAFQDSPLTGVNERVRSVMAGHLRAPSFDEPEVMIDHSLNSPDRKGAFKISPKKESPGTQTASLLARTVLKEDPIVKRLDFGAFNAPPRPMELKPRTINPKIVEGNQVVSKVQLFESLSTSTDPLRAGATSFGIERLDTPKESLEAQKKLKDLQGRFFNIAKTFSKDLRWDQFTPVFNSIMDVFNVLLEDKEFFSCYLAKESKVGKNKTDEMQKKFDDFTASLEKMKSELDSIGVQGLSSEKSNKLCFWSGVEGQKRAHQDEAISDGDVPALKLLFELWFVIRFNEQYCNKPKDMLTSQLPSLFSAIFAEYAVGEVNVYISSQDEKGKSRVNANSAFWNTESHILMKNPKVTKLYVHLTENSIWQPPFDLKGSSPEDKAKREKIMMTRRGDETAVPLKLVSNCAKLWKAKASDEETSKPVSVSNFLEASSPTIKEEMTDRSKSVPTIRPRSRVQKFLRIFKGKPKIDPIS